MLVERLVREQVHLHTLQSHAIQHVLVPAVGFQSLDLWAVRSRIVSCVRAPTQGSGLNSTA